MKHPAKFSKELLPLLAELVGDRRPVLDPMAGTGKIAELLPDIWLNELEPEWVEKCRQRPAFVTIGDARDLPIRDGSFHAVVTSPTYGNRMADHHEAKDPCKGCRGFKHIAGQGPCAACSGTGLSRRNTYTHTLGRKLTEGNTGAMQWGPEYREVHAAIWAECYRVLAPGGRMIVNVKDHIRKGEVVPVSAWHSACLTATGFQIVEAWEVPCPGNRQGANGERRVSYENVMVFEKPAQGPAPAGR